MQEYSRILIEDYCMTHDSEKSRRLERLVKMSYNMYADGTDEDAIFLSKTIRQERNPEFKKALKDLDDFLFGY